MPADRTATGCAPESGTSPVWPPTPGSTSPSATTRPAPRSGTGSSIACSRSSRPTGEADPLTDIRTIVELIAATTTTTGLTAQAAYDPNWYPKGERSNDSDYDTIPLARHDWHGDWNYTIAQSIPR